MDYYRCQIIFRVVHALWAKIGKHKNDNIFKQKLFYFESILFFTIRILHIHDSACCLTFINKFSVNWTCNTNCKNILPLFYFNEEVVNERREANPSMPMDEQAWDCQWHLLPLEIQALCLLKQYMFFLIKHSFQGETEHWERFVVVQSLICSKQNYINDKQTLCGKYRKV